MRQPDSHEAPPKNRNREMNSDGELTRHELELELTRDELTEELTRDELTELLTPVVCPSYTPGLAPHQRTPAPEPTRKRHANPFPPPLLASDFEGGKRKNGGRGDAC